jgi:signal transduction histidine kinase
MIVAVAAIGALAYWDERDRSDAGLDDLGAAQAEAAAALATRADDPASLARLEHDGVRVAVARPGDVLRALDGRPIDLPALSAAVSRGDTIVRVARDDASQLGLPARTAMVGLARLPSGATVAVAATGERQRDRDLAGRRRMLGALAVAIGVVVGFGGLALVRQKRQLGLARELAVAEAARARDAELDRLSRAATMAALASGVAHELSTPLGVIVGRAEQIRDHASDAERIARNAQAILDQADHVDRVVRGLLGLARGAPIALQDVDPERLVREACELVEHRFARADVRLVTSRGDVPSVRCEPGLFEHALVNLLLNACDASPPGAEVRLDVEATATDVAFVVSDDGEGITPADAARAREPFFTTKPAGKGSGLGLAIASEIASSHRGSLAIAPKSPRGTRAAITIPIAEAAHG